MGNMYAAVFPVPVAAHPHTSRPCRATGMVAAWIGVGLSYPKLSMACGVEGEGEVFV